MKAIDRFDPGREVRFALHESLGDDPVAAEEDARDRLDRVGGWNRRRRGRAHQGPPPRALHPEHGTRSAPGPTTERRPAIRGRE